MEKIYSKVEEGTLLHQVNRLEDIDQERNDLSDKKEFLQVATMKLPEGKTFRPHKHRYKLYARFYHTIAQETWIVISGTVRVFFYDIDGSFIKDIVLTTGDCSITYYGGHNYEVLSPGTIVYEVKSGPYIDQKADKEFI